MINRLVGLFIITFSLAACAHTAVPATPTDIPATPMSEAITFYEMMTMEDGTELRYAVVLPAGFTPAEAYPVLLALPPGPQDQSMVEAGLSGYWADTAQERGWIVLSPIAPNGQLFFRGSEQYILEFLEGTAVTYKPEGDKYYLAGVSNGGNSSFRIAIQRPEVFHAMVVVPGLPPTQNDVAALDKITALPVAMYVGERDPWVTGMQEAEAELKRLGGDVQLNVIADEGHVIQSLRGGEVFFDFFEQSRRVE